jgi:hypothetical protein
MCLICPRVEGFWRGTRRVSVFLEGLRGTRNFETLAYSVFRFFSLETRRAPRYKKFWKISLFVFLFFPASLEGLRGTINFETLSYTVFFFFFVFFRETRRAPRYKKFWKISLLGFLFFSRENRRAPRKKKFWKISLFGFLFFFSRETGRAPRNKKFWNISLLGFLFFLFLFPRDKKGSEEQEILKN